MSLRSLVAIAFLAAMPVIGQSSATPAKAAGPVLRTVVDVPMPGPTVRFDYQSLNPTKGRLYIAHMNADQLVVFDTASRKVVANLDGFARVHGVWAVPELGRVYASVTGQHRVDAIDETSLKVIGQAAPVDYPDGLAYAPGPKRIFVSDEHGNADVVIDTQSNKVVANIPLGGGAGNTVYDASARRILVAVHETNELVAIDPEAMRIIGRYPVAGVKETHGVSIDAAHGLAFVAGQALRARFARLSNQRDALGLLEPVFGNDELRVWASEDRPGTLNASARQFTRSGWEGCAHCSSAP